MVLVTAFGRVGLEGVLAKVFHPEARCVANIALLEFETRDTNSAKFVATSAVKLWNLNLLGRDRVAEWRRDVLLYEVRQDRHRSGLLDAEAVFVAPDENGLVELVVGHR